MTGVQTCALQIYIHGLEGSSNSHYARALMARCGEEGVRGVVIHYRGCGGVTNKKLRAYNAADAAELDWEFARLRELYPEAPIYAMGVSLGANNLLFWAGTRGEDAAKLVSGIAAVCAPLDLVGSSHVIRKGFSRIYDLNFISVSHIDATLCRFSPSVFSSIFSSSSATASTYFAKLHRSDSFSSSACT